MFYASAIAWLLLGTLLAAFTSFKLHSPDLLSNVAFLTWGRIRPAHLNVMIYGWASMAGMGTAIWLMARLCRTTLRHPLLLITGGGILESRRPSWASAEFWRATAPAIEWLEFPGLCRVDSFRRLLADHVLGGAHVPLSSRRAISTSRNGICSPRSSGSRGSTRPRKLMLFVVPVQGVMQAAVNWWFANNLLFLWFGSIGLGTAYYMIPKVIGRPVHSYHLAAIGFWTYAFSASWTGMQRLVDGPFPAWMITASIAAMILCIIPVATVGLNHHMTMRGYFPLMRYSPTLRFTVFGAISYTAFSVLGVIISLRSVARYRPIQRGQRWLQSPRSLRLFHHDHVRLDVLHRAAIGRSRMALRLAHQAAFLGLRLRHWTHGLDASCRWFGARHEHG